MHARFLLLFAPLFATAAIAQIPKPDDAPRPLKPEESVRSVRLADGFRLELIAAEPLVKEPSGVCWDHRGRMFVCELHGYNLEGQFDIEQLNATGELDRVVRRVQANEEAKRKAVAGTYGTVKLLVDTDNDGQVDKAHLWADRLPPCYGLCPARDGVIVACAPHIIFLADRDHDGHAEVRETLYTGFDVGALERGISNPQWGLDGWIYVGRGAGGGTITGPHLAESVDLPRTDFRIRADGSAIEPVTGGTGTFGFAFAEDGSRYVISTRTPAIYVAPLPWRYLARNPHYSVSRIDIDVSSGSRVFPLSRPHPWRTKRFDDPGFSKYYTDRYGTEESAPNGYFTSACSPLVYQGHALPGLHGHLLACEPAQNLVHRAIVDHSGVVPSLRRPPAEAESEFLASSDTWFHPMSLAHAPDDSVVVVDFYREIIEDYSAIPRYLQQQYGLVNGQNYGRLWRLTHMEASSAADADMTDLSAGQLAAEIAGNNFWRCQTAQRLIAERQLKQAGPELRALLQEDSPVASKLSALYALRSLNLLTADDVSALLRDERPAVRIHALRLAEPWLDNQPELFAQVRSLSTNQDEKVLLQLALTLGECNRQGAPSILAELAADHGNIMWMPDAILTSSSRRGAAVLSELLKRPLAETHALRLLEPLCHSMAVERNSIELSSALSSLADAKDQAAQQTCLQSMAKAFDSPARVDLTDAGRAALAKLSQSESADVRRAAKTLVVAMKAESLAERAARLLRARSELINIALPPARRLAAVEELAGEKDQFTPLTIAFSSGTPQVRQAILEAFFADRRRLPLLLEAIANQKIDPAALSTVQKTLLRQHADPAIRKAAAELLSAEAEISAETLAEFTMALKSPRDPAAGQRAFRKHCATCHRAHGVGVAVGPDLTAETKRAEETIIRDVLSPSEQISASYATYVIEASDGKVYSGLLAAETATGVTLLQPEGKQVTVLRYNIASITALNVSMMPADLAKSIRPKELADTIAWLRTPPARRTLFDEAEEIVGMLATGDGVASIEREDVHSGFAALRMSPPQRYSAEIDGWEFRIREKPSPGEYRYLRFAWKADGAHGVMIELANRGHWPSADDPKFRYYAGRNTTAWKATRVDENVPRNWQVVTRDLWQDFGDCTLTGIAPTAMGGDALFDQIELTVDAN